MSGTPRPRQVNTGNASQGMISPANPFVNDDGTLTPVSFRFLWGLYHAVATLQAEVATLQQRLANAGIP